MYKAKFYVDERKVSCVETRFRFKDKTAPRQKDIIRWRIEKDDVVIFPNLMKYLENLTEVSGKYTGLCSIHYEGESIKLDTFGKNYLWRTPAFNLSVHPKKQMTIEELIKFLNLDDLDDFILTGKSKRFSFKRE